MSEHADFRRLAAGGEVLATPARDHTAKLVVAGLAPGRWYHYRFVAPDGSISATGRTRTLPADGVAPFTLSASVAGALIEASPELRWADTSGRGYMTVRLAAEPIDTEWLFVDTIRTRSGRIARTHCAATLRNARTLIA